MNKFFSKIRFGDSSVQPAFMFLYSANCSSRKRFSAGGIFIRTGKMPVPGAVSVKFTA